MLNRITGKWLYILMFLLIGVLVLSSAGTAFATDIRSGESVIVAQGEVIDDDLVIFAETIMINGTINGDLVAFGTTVSVNGTVNGSAMLAGQTIRVNGEINGTVYSGGAEIILGPNALIERNVMIGGYSLQAQPGSVIARDLTMGGMQAVLAGKIGRDVQFAGQALELNGQVGRNVLAEIADPDQTPFVMNLGPNMPAAIASGLRVGREAQINGQLSYFSGVDQSNEILATPGGGVVFQAQPVEVMTAVEQPSVTNAMYEWLLRRIRDFITVLVIGLAGLWLARPWMMQAVSHARTKPLAMTGWGFLMLCAGYALAFVVFVGLLLFGFLLGASTLGGLAAASAALGVTGSALFVTLFTAVALWGTKVIVSLLVGKLLLERFAKQYAENPIIAFLLGLTLFEIVAFVPVLGWIVTIVTVLLGLGAIWYVFYDRRRTQSVGMSRPAPMPA